MYKEALGLSRFYFVGICGVGRVYEDNAVAAAHLKADILHINAAAVFDNKVILVALTRGYRVVKRFQRHFRHRNSACAARAEHREAFLGAFGEFLAAGNVAVLKRQGEVVSARGDSAQRLYLNGKAVLGVFLYLGDIRRACHACQNKAVIARKLYENAAHISRTDVLYL